MLNRYIYTINNPYKYYDPDGRNALLLEKAVEMLIRWGLGAIVVEKAAEQVYKNSKEGMHNEEKSDDASVNGEKTTASGPKAENAPGQTAAGQATDKYGNKLGPSSKPMRNKVRHSREKEAEEAAQQEGERAVKHASPKKGEPHYHPADEQGKKIPGSTHHEY